jgi:hypothetical protein
MLGLYSRNLSSRGYILQREIRLKDIAVKAII